MRFTLPDGSSLKTAQDVAYAWVDVQGYTGWTRLHNTHEFETAYRLLVPKGYSRSLMEATLFATPQELEIEPPAGVVLLPPREVHWTADLLRQLQAAGRSGAVLKLYHQSQLELAPFLMARMRRSDILGLAADLGPGVFAAALALRSTQSREMLLQVMGPHRIQQMLSLGDLPDTLRIQVYRSAAFDPSGLKNVPDLMAAAGNPGLSAVQQKVVALTALEWLRDGDPDAASKALRRLFSSSGLVFDPVGVVLPKLFLVPKPAVLALASSKFGAWTTVRDELLELRDPDVCPQLAPDLDSGSVHDPDGHGAAEVLGRVAAGEAPRGWSFTSVLHSPDEWALESVARRWAFAAGENPEAEKALRRLVDVHNRAWGMPTGSMEDPRLRVQIDQARALASMDNLYDLVTLPTAESVTVSDARLEAVRAVASAIAMEIALPTEDPEIRAVLAAVTTAASREAVHVGLLASPEVALT